MFDYIFHPVNNHEYLEYSDEHKWRKKDYAAGMMKKLAEVKPEQTLIRRPAIEAEYKSAPINLMESPE